MKSACRRLAPAGLVLLLALPVYGQSSSTAPAPRGTVAPTQGAARGNTPGSGGPRGGDATPCVKSSEQGQRRDGDQGSRSGGGPGQPGQGQGSRPGRSPELWWRVRSPISKELGLSKTQCEAIEKLFQDTVPELSTHGQELTKREDMLAQNIQDNVAERVIVGNIERVEQARSALNKTRSLMLYRMRQQLNAAQRTKFEALHEEFDIEMQQADIDRQKRQKDEAAKTNPKPAAPPVATPGADRRGRPGF